MSSKRSVGSRIQTELKTSTSSRREYLVDKYGPDPAKAFSDADPLDLPRLADEVRQERFIV